MSAGAERIVLLSGRGEEEAERAEQVVRDSGLAWTLLRASWFAQNFSEGFLADQVASGEVLLPVGDVAEPFVDADDIAEVAVAALTDARHTGQLYELSGPRLLTFAQAVGEIARATGRDLGYQQITAAQNHAAMEAAGVPRRFRLVGRLPLRHRARRAQRPPHRRCAACARPPAARLCRLRAGHGRGRCVVAGAVHSFGGTTGNEDDSPPSTGSACPFTYEASSEARNSAACAISAAGRRGAAG